MTPANPRHTRHRTPSRSRRVLTRLVGAVALLTIVVPTVVMGGASPASAAGGLFLSASTDLDPAGQTISVSGSGFDSSGTRGIYLLFCIQTPSRPTGGQCSGAQAWVSQPGMGATATWSGPGAFTVPLDIVGSWPGVDCRAPGTVCGIVTRNDHTMPGQFDEDSFTPVSFRSDAVEPPTTEPVEPETPVGAVSLTLSRSTDLADGEVITASGSGFVAGQGAYVQLCAAPSGTIGTAAGRPANCYPEQDGTHIVWVNPIAASGKWTTPITVTKTFGAVDCAATSCGIFVRRDHNGGAADFSQDAFVPVTFGDKAAPPAGPARLSVTPTSGLAPAGDTVDVNGSGYRSGDALFVGLCDTAVANFGACDFDNVAEVVATAGAFSVQLPVRASFGSTDCGRVGSTCEVVTWAVSGNDAASEVGVAVTFATGVPGTPTPAPSTPQATAPRPTALARTGSPISTLVVGGLLALIGGALLMAGARRTSET